MPRFALFLAALAAATFATLGGCSSQVTSSPGSDGSIRGSDGGGAACTPPCSSGSICRGGQCVSSEDGGTPSPADGGGSLVDAGSLVDGGCVGTRSTGKRQPLDMYVMLDQSGSMTDRPGRTTKWKAVTDALRAFLNQSGMEGISIGLQLFGLPDTGMCAMVGNSECTSDRDCDLCGPCRETEGSRKKYCIAAISWESCDPAVYANPMVEIADIAAVRATISSALGQSPAKTNTPTSAALQGAVNHAREWALSHPQDVVIAVLATDGEPTECDVSLANINAIAAEGASGTPKVLTFVIGVGESLENLNGIAQAGGTTSALLVDTAGDVNAQFLAALNQIRGETVGCTYVIPAAPDGQQLDFGQVNVQFSPGGGANAILFHQVQSSADCGTRTEAWRYDNPANPRQIILCPETCTTVEAAPSGSVDVVLGCMTSTDGPN